MNPLPSTWRGLKNKGRETDCVLAPAKKQKACY
jgi:hypothetical protein